MTYTSPLSDSELADMAFSIRRILNVRFGEDRVNTWLYGDPELSTAFVKEVFLALRKKVHGL